MMTHVNLMTQQSRKRQCYRDRLRLWSRLLMFAAIVVAIHFAVNWWPHHAQSLDLQALESHYKPLHEQKVGIGKLTRQLSSTRKSYELELAISRDTPALSLVGLLSDAVARCQGKVFLEKIDYIQNGSFENRTKNSDRLSLDGLATDPWAVEHLAEELHKAMPFAEVEITTSEPIEINRHPMQTFQVECKL